MMLDRLLQAVSRVPVQQGCLLRFCVDGGIPAIELLEDCPAMALLLAMKVEYTPSVEEYQRTVVALVGSKRDEILSHCSYPSSKWVVRLLRKIPADQYTLDQHAL